MSNTTKIWKYGKFTGLWRHAKTVEIETANQWLEIFQKHEPDEIFKLSKRKPSKIV